MDSIKKPARHFVAENIEIRWENIYPYFQSLLDEELQTLEGIEHWMLKRSELESILEEDFAWRYIRMTCDTSNETLQQEFEYFATEIEPKLAEYGNKLNEKILNAPNFKDLSEEKYGIYLRALKNQYELFREENIPLFTELQIEQQKYGAIVGAMSIEYKGQTYTLEQASNFLKDGDREVRREVYELIQQRRMQDKNALNSLFDKLLTVRHQVALNAGFENFRDYMFKALGRFDYGVEDCYSFHEAIEKGLMPTMKNLAEARKQALKLDTLRPYDGEVDVTGKPALKPFDGAEELINKSIRTFEKIDSSFGTKLRLMKEHGLLDLESRMNKAPGGYNYPLAETGAPFIFMNSANAMRDLTTMVHEGGHAIHTFLSKDLLLNDFKHTPSEVAEVASMSMELISMDAWDEFFNSDEELTRAKEEQLKDCLKTLPWVACIDAFQHWLYTNPGHTHAAREEKWISLSNTYGGQFIDWSGYEEFQKYQWQKQLHLFEVPFYYIEYAIAQLAAIAIYKNYKADKGKTLDQYKAALTLGYTKSIPEIYAAAGIRFDFSADYIQSLVKFVEKELKDLTHA